MIRGSAKSIKTILLNTARKEQLNYQLLIIRYLYERLLYRLSISKYRDHFYLKGGVLLYAFEREYARPTLDIDFLGLKVKNDVVSIQEIFREICEVTYPDDGIVFNLDTLTAEEISEHKTYAGIRLSITAELDSIKQIMKIDIGFGDAVVPDAQVLSYPVIMMDLPAATILAYSLETVVAEKFQAMIELAEVNSRYKDFYDVYKMLSNHTLQDDLLAAAVISTFKTRSTPYQENHSLFSENFVKDAIRNRQWLQFLKKINQDSELSFQTVMELITLRLMPIYQQLQ